MKVITKFVVFVGLIFATFSSAFAGEWVVKRGDSLSKIASYYPGVTAGEICRANSHMFKVKGCEHIEPGWVLVIPEVGDCFDATMTVAMKQKSFDKWDKQVVSNYRDGKPGCGFEDLLQIPQKNEKVPVVLDLTVADPTISDRLSLLEDVVGEHISESIRLSIFTSYYFDGLGVGLMLKTPSEFMMSYGFKFNDKKQENELLFGKYDDEVFWGIGPKVSNDSNNNSSAMGLKGAVVYMPKISDSFSLRLELGGNIFRVSEGKINGSPELSFDEDKKTLSLTTPVVRDEKKYWDFSAHVSVGLMYQF